MVLLDERERNLVTSKLASLKDDILSITEGKTLFIRLKGLEIMNDDPSQVHVLYMKCETEDDRFQIISDTVARKFADTGTYHITNII